ncbi:hypothetical protein AALP_AAs52006U000200 [Arabis alpina]|uniref:Uncharacterized protein n=1 Tax=Arabis alpina TaxID=50452 RepID=A0A087FXP3_ARAAL|nr:hypothetical protein AALP_AAs52006U000200 [Arabis alpina]
MGDLMRNKHDNILTVRPNISLSGPSPQGDLPLPPKTTASWLSEPPPPPPSSEHASHTRNVAKINRRSSSPVEHGPDLIYTSYRSYDLLSPSSESQPPVNRHLSQDIDASLCVVTRQPPSTSLLPKPPDQPLEEPNDLPQPP